MRVVHDYSPNQSGWTHGEEAIDLVICHTAEGGYTGTVAYLKSPAVQVSYHLLINEDGSEATQLVPWSRKAWHAKVYNSRAEGISCAGHARSFDVRSAQARAFARVVAERLVERGLPCRWARDGSGQGFCRHGDVQSDRSDPMSPEKFDLFVDMVREQYDLIRSPKKPEPEEPEPERPFATEAAERLAWARWRRNGGRPWQRPRGVRLRIPKQWWAWYARWVAENPWPRPLPGWYWTWERWLDLGRTGPRPRGVPVVVPEWAWKRRKVRLAAASN